MISIITSNNFKRIWKAIRAQFVAKEAGKSLSTNDYTNEEKEKLRNVQAGAEVNDISQIHIDTYKTVSDAINNEKINSTQAIVGNRVAEIKLNLEENFGLVEASEEDIDKLLEQTMGTEVNPSLTPAPRPSGDTEPGEASTGETPVNIDTSELAKKSQTISNIYRLGNDYVLKYADGREKKIEIPVDKDTTYTEATATSAGLLSATDKTKIDALDATLGKITEDIGKSQKEDQRLIDRIMELDERIDEIKFGQTAVKETRQPYTEYKNGALVLAQGLPTGSYLECVTPGTTSNNDLDLTGHQVGDVVADGTLSWQIKNTKISRDLFEIDKDGCLTPVEVASYSDDFELDEDGNIMPKG